MVHIEDIVIRVILVLATSFLFGVVLLTYIRIRSRKMLLISFGFGIFFVHALTYIPLLFIEEYSAVFPENVHLLIHLVALTFIALGMLKD